MSKRVFQLLVFCMLSIQLQAQQVTIEGVTVKIEKDESELSTKMGFGFQVGQIQREFAIGLNLTSPYFMYDNIAVRVKGNLVWHEHINSIVETTWTSYSNLSIGVVGVGGQVGTFVRLYGEGGVLFLFPSDDFSSESSELGGYGLFGFEFFMSPNMNYYLEVGGVGTGAIADKVIGKPIYSNGLLINVGFRFLL